MAAVKINTNVYRNKFYHNTRREYNKHVLAFIVSIFQFLLFRFFFFFLRFGPSRTPEVRSARTLLAGPPFMRLAPPTAGQRAS